MFCAMRRQRVLLFFVAKRDVDLNMSEKEGFIPPERGRAGQEVYKDSMELSADEKWHEMRPWLIPGRMADVGAGAGPITERMAKEYPDSEVIAVDNSPPMVIAMRERLNSYPNVKIIEADVRDVKLPDGITTAVCASIGHEVKSIRGLDSDVIQMYRNIRDHLAPNGRLIVRDGVKPPPETLYVQPLTKLAVERFGIFTKLFKDVRDFDWATGTIDPANLSWRRTDKKPGVGSLIQMQSADVNELLSKYHYKKQNLPIEMRELFGVWTLEEYQNVMKGLGLDILHAESFLLPFLLKRYSEDFKIYRIVDNVLSNTDYTKSTMLLVAKLRA